MSNKIVYKSTYLTINFTPIWDYWPSSCSSRHLISYLEWSQVSAKNYQILQHLLLLYNVRFSDFFYFRHNVAVLRQFDSTKFVKNLHKKKEQRQWNENLIFYQNAFFFLVFLLEDFLIFTFLLKCKKSMLFSAAFVKQYNFFLCVEQMNKKR